MATVAERVGHQDEVVVKAAAEAAKLQSRIKVSTAEEVGAKMVSGPQVEVPPEILEQAQAFIDDYSAFLVDRTERYGERLAATQTKKRRGLEVELGAPTQSPNGLCPDGYEAFDILTYSPIQFIGLPPYEPGKIIAGGELAVIWSLVWTNPFPNIPCGYAVPPTVQLINKTVRVSVDLVNLTAMTTFANFVFVFPHPGNPFIWIPTFFIAPPVATPQLLEVNATVDIVWPRQPYAAFATWHQDFDSEPSWLFNFPPNTSPQLEHDTPLRVLVYPQ